MELESEVRSLSEWHEGRGRGRRAFAGFGTLAASADAAAAIMGAFSWASRLTDLGVEMAFVCGAAAVTLSSLGETVLSGCVPFRARFL